MAPAAFPTLGALLDWVAPGVTVEQLLAWPPDALGVALAALQKSGAYLQIVECGQWPPAGVAKWNGRPTSSWHQFARHVGRRWREHALQAATNPKATPHSSLADNLGDWLHELFQRREVALAQIKSDAELRHILHQIVATADEAFAGVGFRADGLGTIYSLGAQQLTRNNGRTLCQRINPEVLVVLPKQHTPQTGMTIRTLTHHLGIYWAGEVTPQWILALSNILTPPGAVPLSPESPPKDPTSPDGAIAPADLPLNILVVPWPDQVVPTQFSPAPWSLSKQNQGSHGFFAFEHLAAPTLGERQVALEALYRAACQKCKRIDGVILPELALNGDAEVEQLGRAFLEWNSAGFFIAGVGTTALDQKPGGNKACVMFKIGKTVVRIDQGKHHRWQVEQSQIASYGLGAMLNPFVRWWEHIELHERKLTFMPFTPSLTATVLICEDLARQEPASDLIRAVGPNLVVALLMDGPQLASRWPSRYATVLADDPGSSVLTVTSLGMCELSRPRGREPSRVVAQWKDSISGVREISLPGDASAVVLSLANRMTTEWTSDGRSDAGASNVLTLSGEYPIRLPGAGLGGKVT